MCFQRSSGCFRLTIARYATFVILLFGGIAQAETADDALIRDLWQTVQARKILLDDPQLAPLNLGIRVSNGMAELWGPVPSPALSQRAEQRLRSMYELIDVQNHLSVDLDDKAAALAPAAPASPQYLPENLSPAPPKERRQLTPAPERHNGVDLAGIVTPEETIVVRSSPLVLNVSQPGGLPTLHIPFLGSVQLPR